MKKDQSRTPNGGPISEGDLVVVVRGTLCCGSSLTLGYMFIVGDFYSGPTSCSCGADQDMTIARPAGDFNGWEVERLKRVPPLSELEGQRTEEDLREPA